MHAIFLDRLVSIISVTKAFNNPPLSAVMAADYFKLWNIDSLEYPSSTASSFYYDIRKLIIFIFKFERATKQDGHKNGFYSSPIEFHAL